MIWYGTVWYLLDTNYLLYTEHSGKSYLYIYMCVCVCVCVCVCMYVFGLTYYKITRYNIYLYTNHIHIYDKYKSIAKI